MKGEIYPSYFRQQSGVLIAVTAPDKMFILYPRGRNTNPGVTLDHFITRKMVKRYYGCGDRITKGQFIEWYNKIYTSYLQHIIVQS